MNFLLQRMMFDKNAVFKAKESESWICLELLLRGCVLFEGDWLGKEDWKDLGREVEALDLSKLNQGDRDALESIKSQIDEASLKS